MPLHKWALTKNQVSQLIARASHQCTVQFYIVNRDVAASITCVSAPVIPVAPLSWHILHPRRANQLAYIYLLQSLHRQSTTCALKHRHLKLKFPRTIPCASRRFVLTPHSNSQTVAPFLCFDVHSVISACCCPISCRVNFLLLLIAAWTSRTAYSYPHFTHFTHFTMYCHDSY